ncbi:M1 family metallopeptidase [Phaeodactylibacter luteus]|uniref:M1 family metallopeptidase n=1 Tax=Phaeodactylibacter luteus TaxID=1564516 RepID=A0A5C6RH06_9BACT|nr:M1 family metallopeptidase [Phaeodactylibacter luteus]TXB60593.1 M1 family metallopeptidase [Phaeodactylibacter luteus]
MKIWNVLCLLLLTSLALQAQPDRWQQRADYKMTIDFDVKKHQFKGEQTLVYTNNSPDTLDRVFYHLYFNAFQPNSMMDVRSQTIKDADPRVGNRIGQLSPDEVGYHKIKRLSMDGEAVSFEVVGTVLEADLPKPILPGATATFEMSFDSQVPIQIRRSGRDNAEGVAYSMAQWYPKMAEYDYQGWHANPYIGREFYGIWADFDVTINIDKDYIIGGTGYLQNPEEIGHGYVEEGKVKKQKGKKLSWHFKAPDVHDFMWGADPDYEHTTFTREDGMVMHFFFQPNEKTSENWAALPGIMDEAFSFINKHYGQYPYEQYSFIQGGDGGMEYPMATLITGERSLPSLVGVSVHELMHSWYQMLLGTNESLYAWMDEGFTSWASNYVMNHLRSKGLIPGQVSENPMAGSYMGYANFSQSGLEEPLSVHSDHFQTNAAYSVASYVKGAVFLEQLKCIIGEEALAKGMLRYFDTWKFKHPNANDFIRVMEKVSGLELDWYKEYMVNTTHTIDYGVKGFSEADGEAVATLERIGLMPMPLDVVVAKTDGSTMSFHIPLQIMRGHKPLAGATLAEDWAWTHPTYDLPLGIPLSDVKAVRIDPGMSMVDIDRANNERAPE